VYMCTRVRGAFSKDRKERAFPGILILQERPANALCVSSGVDFYSGCTHRQWFCAARTFIVPVILEGNAVIFFTGVP
jgi:hypothetical protein